MKQQVIDLVTDDRAAGSAAAGTLATSFATMLDIIPANIGNLGVLVGILLSVTLLVIHIRSEIRKTKLDNLVIALREKELRGEKDA